MMNISLREVEESDLPIFYEHQLDPDACCMAAFPARARDTFMAHWAKIRANQAVIARTIIADGAVAGSILLWEQDGKTFIGYWLGKAHWGRGIASAALAQFVAQVQARPLHAYVAKHNAASIRVLQKCGFTICGEDRFTGANWEGCEEFIMKLE